MTDIFDEIDQDLRRERLSRVWSRYGIYVILIAVLIVVVTAGWRGYEWWVTRTERNAGEAYAALVAEVDAEGAGADPARLTAFADDAPEGFALLARFRAASLQAATGETEAAAETLRGIASDSAAPRLYQDLARMRLGYVLLDADDVSGAREAVAPMADDAGNAFHRSASEVMGLAAYAEDDLDDAERWFTNVSSDATVSQGMRQRADTMLALITRLKAQAEAAANAPAADTTPAESAPAESAPAGSPSSESAPADAAPGSGLSFPMPSGDVSPSLGTSSGAFSFPMPEGEASDGIGDAAPALVPSPAESTPSEAGVPAESEDTTEGNN